MLTPAATEIVTLEAMTPAAREALADALYEVNRRIFAGVDRQVFVRYVIESSAEHTWILLYKDAQGAIVGYFALHIFERQLHGEAVAIVRAQVGLLSAYRGGNVTAAFAIERLVRYMVAHPRRRLLLFAALVHPSSYAQLVRYADEVYPSPKAETPADIAGLMQELAAEFHFSPVDEADPMICKVEWQTIDTARDRARWQASESEAVHYFVERNPGFVDGCGLLTVVPISFGTLLRAGARFASAKASTWVRKATGAAQAPTPATT